MLYIVTILSQLLFFLYRQFIVLVNLYPFNDLQSYPLYFKIPEIVLNGLFLILPPIGFMWDIESLQLYALCFYPMNVVGSFCIWWIPYLLGPGFGHRKLFQGLFGRTIRVLPPINGRPAPDLQHCILHAIALVTTILTFITYFRGA